MLSSSINQQFAVKKPAKALEHIPFAEQFIPPGRFRHRHMDATSACSREVTGVSREKAYSSLVFFFSASASVAFFATAG